VYHLGTIWNNQIDLVKSNGNYQFKDLRVKCFNGKFLTSTSLSVIQPSTLVNYKQRAVVPVESKSVDFPPICIDQYEETYSCLKCKRMAARCGDFIICESCNAKSMHTPTSKHLKACFQKDCSNVVLMLLRQVVWPFLTSIGITEHDTQNDVEKALLLTCKNYKVSYRNFIATEITKKE